MLKNFIAVLLSCWFLSPATIAATSSSSNLAIPVVPAISINPLTLPISSSGSVVVKNQNQNVAVSISNISITGGSAGDFSITANTCPSSLLGNASCSVTVSFIGNGSNETVTLNVTSTPGHIVSSTVVGSAINLGVTLVVTPSAPTFLSSTPPGANVAALQGIRSDNLPFTGGFIFVAPNYDVNGTYAASGNNLIIGPNGPGVGSAGGTVQHVTMEAVQLDPTPDGVISTAPSGPPLKNSAGYWSWSARQIFAGNYAIYLNGHQTGVFDSAVLMEVAHGGHLYVKSYTGDWYVWNGATFSINAGP